MLPSFNDVPFASKFFSSSINGIVMELQLNVVKVISTVVIT